MQKRNRAKRFEKKQVGEFDFVFERPASCAALIESLQEDTQELNKLVNEFEKMLGL